MANGVACEAEPAGEAYGRFAQLDSDFHDLITEASGSELIQETLAGLHIHVHLFRLFYHARVTADAIEEHQRIIQALSERRRRSGNGHATSSGTLS